MKYLLISFIFLITINCSLKKVSNSHGSRFIGQKYDKILLNQSNKNDIRRLIGPPSSIGKFNNTWIYIERTQTNQNLLKLGKKKINSNNIIVLDFDKTGIVSNKNLLNLNNMNSIKIAEKITEKKFSQNNKIYDILSSLREKINSPIRRNK